MAKSLVILVFLASLASQMAHLSGQEETNRSSKSSGDLTAGTSSRERQSSSERIFHSHEGQVWSLAFSPEGTLASAGFYDPPRKTVKIWNVAKEPPEFVVDLPSTTNMLF